MNPGTRSSVVGTFMDRGIAEAAMEELREMGFGAEVGLAAPSVPAQGASGPPTWETGAGVGLLTGASVGGLAAGLPGVVAGGLAGGLIGALIDLGVPETDARFFHDEYQAGRTVVIVRAGERAAEAAEVLRRYGAKEVRR